MAASGVGALGGAVYLAARRSVVGLGTVIAYAAAGMGVALVAFSFSRHLGLSMAVVAFIGLAMIVNFAAANTLLQTLTEERMRGRVMAFFSMAFLGMAPFGNLLAGWLAWGLGGHRGDPVGGASWTILMCGVVCVGVAGYFAVKLPALRKLVRPVYEQKGILPRPVASGLQTATDAVTAPEG
jgi:MFS family permease